VAAAARAIGVVAHRVVSGSAFSHTQQAVLLDAAPETVEFWASSGSFGTVPVPGRRPRRCDPVVFAHCRVYGECMARMISTTVRLEEEDVRALKRARAAGHSTSELIRKGLRVVASRYYTGRRAPSTRLFESTDNKLGEESELFRDLEG
jgi:hypothetical protein